MIIATRYDHSTRELVLTHDDGSETRVFNEDIRAAYEKDIVKIVSSEYSRKARESYQGTGCQSCLRMASKFCPSCVNNSLFIPRIKGGPANGQR